MAYFGKSVDLAIENFQKETDIRVKHRIFEKSIKPAFDKLINYHYYRVPVAKDPEVIHDCLSFLYEQIHKFKPHESKGFSYFNVIVKNYFIQKLKQENKENGKSSGMVTHFSLDDPKTESHLDSADLEEKVLDEEFLKTIKDNLTEWKSHFNKEQEKKVLDAVILIFDNCKNIDICDRKAIFFYIKEITGLKYVQIASNLSKIKKKYTYLKKKYKRGEI